MKKVFKNILKFFLLLFVAGIIFIAFANYSIKKYSNAYVSNYLEEIPKTKTALLLGTSKKLNKRTTKCLFL
ncbi:hypothetical protein [Chryseobacterium sp.]|jgi:SanA protein|uniref:hypothetical protein n=1 Tax=Chryseobacterium sp. TaxID=1871047 RepID=UPI00261B1E89|nr:hypothetical protein [Chryseobacterium sp.]